MAIPTRVLSEAQHQLDRFCGARVPPGFSDEIRLSQAVEGHALILYEERPSYEPGRTRHWTRLPIARFRYTATQGTWTLFWSDRNERWRAYDLEPATGIGVLLAEVDRDPTGVFWG